MTAGALRGRALQDFTDRWRRPAMVAGLAFAILVGATPVGEVSGRAQLLMVFIGAAALWAAVRALRRGMDRVDQLAMASYLLFLVTIALSDFPRQSFDIALSTLGILAVFWLARRELADGRSFKALADLLVAVSVMVGAAALVSWGQVWVEWLSRTGTLPPELPLSGLVFGNIHDVAILVMLCAPAAFLHHIGWRRYLALPIVPLAVVVVLVDGSRNIMLAAVVATSVVGLRFWAKRRARLPRGRAIAALLGTVLVVGALALWSGFAGRLLNPDTLGVRIWLWTASVDLWLMDPLFGHGPGSFPWLLSLTDYVNLTSFSPRHPDNAIAQLLAEGGLIGVAAGTTAVLTVWVGARRNRPPLPALWALTFFACCGLFANPTDFGFLVIPALLWAAVATVRRPLLGDDAEPVMPERPWVRPATSLAAIGALVAAIVFPLASVLHDEASARWQAGQSGPAIERLGLAAFLDPGTALYHRELGAMYYTSGNAVRARPLLERAVALNPSDLAALRLLAMAQQDTGDDEAALSAAREAATRAPLETVSLMTLARVEAVAGHQDEAARLVAEVLEERPWVTGALELNALGIDLTIDEALDLAIDGWLGAPGPSDPRIQPGWLTALRGRSDLMESAQGAYPGAERTVQALHELLRCELDRAQSTLEEALPDEGKTVWFWSVKYMVEQAAGEVRPATEWSVAFISRLARSSEWPSAAAVHNGSADFWGYGRRTTPFSPMPSLPPTDRVGLTRWMLEPVETAAARVPGRPLGGAGCTAGKG